VILSHDLKTPITSLTLLFWRRADETRIRGGASTCGISLDAEIMLQSRRFFHPHCVNFAQLTIARAFCIWRKISWSFTRHHHIIPLICPLVICVCMSRSEGPDHRGGRMALCNRMEFQMVYFFFSAIAFFGLIDISRRITPTSILLLFYTNTGMGRSMCARLRKYMCNL
jgi:hypothetical protein